MRAQHAERSFPELILASRIERAAEPGKPDEGWTLKSLAGRMIEISGEASAATLTAAASLVLQAQLLTEPAVWITVGNATFYPPDLAESGIDLDALPVVRVATPTQGARVADCLLRSGGISIAVLDLAGVEDGSCRGESRSRTSSRRSDESRSHSRHGDESRSRTSSSRGAPASGSSRHGDPKASGRHYDSEAQVFASRSRSSGSDGARNTESAHTLSISTQARLAGLAKKHETVLLCLTRKDRDLPSLGSMVSLRGTGAVRKTAFDRFLWTFEVLKDKHRGPGWTHSEACRGPAGLH